MNYFFVVLLGDLICENWINDREIEVQKYVKLLILFLLSDFGTFKKVRNGTMNPVWIGQ